MAKQEVSAVQIQMAAAAGVALLENKELPVPLHIAKSGALGILEGILQGISQGELVLGPPPPPNAAVAEGVKAALTPVPKEPAADNDEGSEGSVATPAEETLHDDDGPAVADAQA